MVNATSEGLGMPLKTTNIVCWSQSALAQPHPSGAGRGDGTLRVLVDTPSGEFFAVWAELTTPLATWRILVQQATGIPTALQRWEWDGLELDEAVELQTYYLIPG